MQIVGCGGPHAGGVEKVRFGKVQPCPIVARAPATSDLDRQASHEKPPVERKAGRVHRRRVLEGCASLGLDFGVAELGGGAVALGLVAVVAAERQIAYPVGAAAIPGRYMIDLERYVLSPAVGAAAAPLLKQIGASVPQ